MALCAGLQTGEIAVFDKAYVHFKHLFSLTKMGVFWVTRAKDSMRYHICKKRKVSGNIVRDDEITLKTKSSKEYYPQRMQRVVARVEVNGKTVEMVFINNNMDWAASSICDLYQSRWAIEVFFKQIKQTLQICDFLGHSIKPSVGNSGPRYCCICFFVFKHGTRTGHIASHASLR